MDMELRNRLMNPGESGYSADDIAAAINAYDELEKAATNYKSSADAKIESLTNDSSNFAKEISQLKVQNFDQMMEIAKYQQNKDATPAPEMDVSDGLAGLLTKG